MYGRFFIKQGFSPSQVVGLGKQNPRENILKKRLQVLQDQYLDNLTKYEPQQKYFYIHANIINFDEYTIAIVKS